MLVIVASGQISAGEFSALELLKCLRSHLLTTETETDVKVAASASPTATRAGTAKIGAIWKGALLMSCCSEHGFCGTTEEYCGDDDKVERPSCSVSDTTVNRVIGYYEAWSTSGRRCYGMLPEEIPFGYYTHINFAFATIDPGTFELIPGDDRTDDYMRRIQSLKFIQPDVKVWIAVGGWTFNDPGPTATTFSDIAASTEAQDAFISSLIRMMNTYGFDGLDLDWEYPGAEDRNGREEDFENFVSFMDRMRKKLNDKGLSKKGLSLTLPSSYWYLRHFDIKKLERSVDWFNIMSYDIHGSWDIDNDFTGPWVNSHTNLTEIQLALDLLWRNDIDPDKVVLGMSFYSRSFALADPGCSEPGCVVVSGGNAGDCSGTTGVLLHAEIQDLIKENHLSPKLYHDAAYKAVTWGDQWVSFDDLATWRLKSSVFRSQCISGIMVWAASQDDKAGTNIKALVSSVGRKVMDAPEFVEKAPQADPVLQGPAKSCTWAACGQDCPSGFKLIWRDSHREQIFGASCSVGGTSKWCCPAGQDLPTCEWRGHKNSGRCKAGCNAGEVEVGSINVGCQSGYQSACCTTTDSTKAWGNCAWTTGQCEVHEKQECPLGRPHRVAGAAWAWGNVPPCSYGMAERSYCCTEPPPGDFAKCSWITDVEDRKGKYCDACRDDQVKVAGRSTSTCFTPSEALCCDRPKLDKRDDNDEPSYDPFGSQQTKELRALIKAYTDNPTCPATILEPPIHDPFQGRSLVDEAREHDELHGRATDCYRSDWDMLQTMGTNMIVQRYSYMDNLVDIWDDELAGGLDEQYEIASLRNFFDSLRYDPRGTLDTIMYNPVDGGSQLRRARDFPTVLCGIDYAAADMASVDAELEQLTNKTATRRDILDSRNVWAFGSRTDNSPNDVPNLSTILTAILSGILSLHYARWQWYTAAGADNLNQGPFLELAYWIGPQPGVTPDNPTQYDIYRDTRTGRTGDRWVGQLNQILSPSP